MTTKSLDIDFDGDCAVFVSGNSAAIIIGSDNEVVEIRLSKQTALEVTKALNATFETELQNG